ncbi:hypothetical protein PIB30_063170 [Stylosanthes scabra]|uniref:Transposase n=1 Tax=Stylosanthes scabra TaxID=79078 RepID=A0ABU6ZK20_9FABA|nr:hypothetical protein [Stylosanthes scabra]
MNVTDSTKGDSTDVLQRKLDAIHKRNNTVLSTSVTQQRSLENSAQSAGYQGQHNNVQLTQERIQERQEEFPLPSLESEPEPEGGMRDDNGSELGKGNIVVRATTIDEFLKEHGIDVDLDGISIGEQTTDLLDDSEDSEALDQNYYQYVMAESDDEEGNILNLSTCILFWNFHLTALTKFILPASAEKWVIQTIRDAWKRFKTKLKQKHFDPYDNYDDMVKNRPLRVPEDQFVKLLLYWGHPTIQERSQRNKNNRKQQKFPHRMGPVNFAREIFQSRQASGETEEEAFRSIFGKEQPGWVRCYGRSVTQTELQRHSEISALKQQHQEEVTTLRSELGDVKTQQQQQSEEINGLRSLVKQLLLRSEPTCAQFSN